MTQMPTDTWEKPDMEVKSTVLSSALRYNEGKPKMSELPMFLFGNAVGMIPYENFIRLCRVCEYGAAKYDSYSWTNGHDVKGLMDSFTRHWLQHVCGETLDAESQLPHLDHAVWNALMIIHNIKDWDDFPNYSETRDLTLMKAAAWMNRSLCFSEMYSLCEAAKSFVLRAYTRRNEDSQEETYGVE